MDQLVIVEKLTAKTLKEIPKADHKRFLLYFECEDLSPNILNKLEKNFYPVCLNKFVENVTFIFFTNTYYHSLSLNEKNELLDKLSVTPYTIFYAELPTTNERIDSREADLQRRLVDLFQLDDAFLYYYPTVLTYRKAIKCHDITTV